MRAQPSKALGSWDVYWSRRESFWRRLTPSQLLVGSFFLLITIGTVGLEVIPGLYTGEGLGWIDALFTMTSAVCVTGLIVVDTATYFTHAGQAWILLFIQLGGLGIITFTTLIILALGRRLSLRQQQISSSGLEAAPHVDLGRLTKNVIAFTAAFEGLGALLLMYAWVPRFGWLDGGWHALFHSVSAFCNAGFSTFTENLVGEQGSALVLGTIALLIILGGLGFLTLEEIRGWIVARRSGLPYRISLHTRIVLVVTAALILGGTVLLTAFEWRVTLARLPYLDRVLNGFFMSVTPRTAGFNSIAYGDATVATNFLTILLMFIGGSPGSTAGGVKTTTFALVGLLAWSRFRGQQTTSAAHRTVPEETIQRAVGLTIAAFTLITIAIFVCIIAEYGAMPASSAEAKFLPFMFEATSAFNTVGLSMGITAVLGATSKVVLILLMFLGRVGPLTFAAAIALQAPTPVGEFRYAYEDVVVG